MAQSTMLLPISPMMFLSHRKPLLIPSPRPLTICLPVLTSQDPAPDKALRMTFLIPPTMDPICDTFADRKAVMLFQMLAKKPLTADHAEFHTEDMNAKAELIVFCKDAMTGERYETIPFHTPVKKPLTENHVADHAEEIAPNVALIAALMVPSIGVRKVVIPFQMDVKKLLIADQAVFHVVEMTVMKPLIASASP